VEGLIIKGKVLHIKLLLDERGCIREHWVKPMFDIVLWMKIISF